MPQIKKFLFGAVNINPWWSSGELPTCLHWACSSPGHPHLPRFAICRDSRESVGSQRGEDHEDLVAVVARCQPQRTRPATDLPPAEPGIEVLQPHGAPRGEMQLLQAHLLAGDMPGVRHQSSADSLTPESREGLQVADRAPMGDDRIRVTLQVHPAGQDIAHGSDQEPAVGTEAGNELIRYRRDNGGSDGNKWKA